MYICLYMLIMDMEVVASGQLQVRTSRTSELSARLMNGFHCWSLHQRDAPQTQAGGAERCVWLGSIASPKDTDSL